MAYLSGIIRAIETHFEVEIEGEAYPRSLINGVHFLDENDAEISHLAPSILYLADYQRSPFGELYGNVLYVGCDSATPPGKAMYIRKSIDLFALYNVISDSLLSYQRMRQNEEALFNNLYAGRGIPGLLRIAHGVLENPIVVLDSIFSRISCYPDDDDPFFESSNGVLMLNNQVLCAMKNSNLLYRIQHSVFPFSVYVEDIGYELVFESIRIQRAVIGYLCVRCSSRSLSDDELEYVHALSQMISLQLHQSNSFPNPYGLKYDMFLNHLVTHHFDTEESARQHLGFLNIQQKKSFYLVASGLYEKPAKQLTRDYYCGQFSNMFPNSITGVMGDRYITLISSDDPVYFTSTVLNRFESFLTMNKMKASVSYIFDSLLDASKFLEQTLSQLNYLLVNYTEHAVGFYSDYYIRHLVELSGNYDLLKSMIHPSILAMEAYDRAHQTNYLETLITFFCSNRNAPAAAKALFIHKSTLFYRFGKMSSLFQIDLNDKDALFTYEFSLHLLDILNTQKKSGF